MKYFRYVAKDSKGNTWITPWTSCEKFTLGMISQTSDTMKVIYKEYHMEFKDE